MLNEGIILRANEATNKYAIAQEKEQIGIALSEWAIQKNIAGNTKTFKEVMESALSEISTVTGENNGPLTMTMNKTGNQYTVKEDGTIDGPLESGGDSTDAEGGGSDVTPPGGTVVPEIYATTITGLAEGVSLVEYGNLEESLKTSADSGKITAVLTETKDSKTYTAVVPAGFTVSTTDGEDSISGGLVIRDGLGNEFVWIPVPANEFSSFAILQEEGSENYTGVLDATNTTNTNYKEPANLTYSKTWSSETTLTNGKTVEAGTSYTYDGQDMFNLFDMGTYSETYYQDKFDNMVESVAKYGGFYVGRYETSLSGNTAQSKAGQPVMNNIEWYRMYTSSETYSQSGVISEMIWGCQWDAMMRFIGDKATETGNVSHDLSSVYSTGGTDYTGSVTYNDIANNIYDLEGNVFEWTQEANETSSKLRNRVLRGSYWGYNESPDFRYLSFPTAAEVIYGSRLALYIEL